MVIPVTTLSGLVLGLMVGLLRVNTPLADGYACSTVVVRRPFYKAGSFSFHHFNLVCVDFGVGTPYCLLVFYSGSQERLVCQFFDVFRTVTEISLDTCCPCRLSSRYFALSSVSKLWPCIWYGYFARLRLFVILRTCHLSSSTKYILFGCISNGIYLEYMRGKIIR